MTLDEIFDLWEQDAKIDTSELGKIALDIPKLHHKYFKLFSRERLLQKKLQAELKQLKLEKSEFFADGPTEDQRDKGWKLPAKGKILRTDVGRYVDADQDIINLNLKIAYQQEKIDLLESIIKVIVNRGFQVNAAISWERFKVGA
jgi:hypothetical protein